MIAINDKNYIKEANQRKVSLHTRLHAFPLMHGEMPSLWHQGRGRRSVGGGGVAITGQRASLVSPILSDQNFARFPDRLYV